MTQKMGMVLCVIALLVFGVLGVFSARYRGLAKEAFDCVFRKVTFRPCATNLNQRIRAKIVAKIFVRSPKLAGFVRHYFEPFSWAFTLLMLGSAALTLQAGYNLYKYGTCTPSNPGQCVFSPEPTGCGSPNCTSGCVLPDKTCTQDCNCMTSTCG